MSGIVLTLDLQGQPADGEAARAMARAALYRSRGGLRDKALDSAVGIHLDGGEEPLLVRSSPLTSSDGLLLVADARIDNRRALAATLGRQTGAPFDDGALLLAAYRYWGEAFADHLAGDFALALWDSAARRLVAARDPFGMRPLVYRLEPARILVASDVSQILAVEGVPDDLNEARLAAALADLGGLEEWTAYRAVTRLPPGHTLIVDDRGPRVRTGAVFDRGVTPAREPLTSYLERLRSTLADAVHARLEVTAVPGLLLSGGLDSTSIAAAAARRDQGRGVAERSLHTYSFASERTPECDERDVSDLVAAHLGLRNTPVSIDGAWPLTGYPDHGPERDGPERFRSHAMLDRALAAAGRDAVTLLLSGQRGGALTGRDTALHAPWGRGGAWRRTLQYLGAASLHHLPVTVARGVRHAWTPHPFPPWLLRAAIDRHHLRDVFDSERPPSPLRDEARRRRRHEILSARASRDAEALERQFARAGIRHTAPWADRQLTELAIALPQRLVSAPEQPKRLLREAMREWLPDPIRPATRKRSPQSFFLQGLRDQTSDVVWRLLEGSHLAARGLVDGRVLRATYRRLQSRESPGGDLEWRWFWHYLNVEDWLRRFHAGRTGSGG